jgi:hypothetical protein
MDMGASLNVEADIGEAKAAALGVESGMGRRTPSALEGLVAVVGFDAGNATIAGADELGDVGGELLAGYERTGIARDGGGPVDPQDGEAATLVFGVLAAASLKIAIVAAGRADIVFVSPWEAESCPTRRGN